MRFDRIAALFAAATSHIVMPHSPSTRDPPGGGVGGAAAGGGGGGCGGGLGRAFAGGGAGDQEPLRLSASLQDLTACVKLDLEQGCIGDEPGYTRSDSELDLLRATAASGGSSKVKVKGGPSPPASRFLWKKLAKRAGLGICIVLLLFLISLSVVHFAGSWSPNSTSHYVILDCGSTGTRVYVYEWTVNKKKHTNGLPITLRSLPKHSKWKLRRKSGRAYQRMETEPGFDKLVRNETGLRTAMTPLLRWAEKQIPKRAHASTSVFLYATAGVRRLPKSDSDWLLDKAWGILKDSSDFSCRKDRVKIISGMEEAYYGWIALNHHMGNLGAIPAKETFGALDLGGSSLQVTFETERMIHDESALRLNIGSANHHLSAYSLPGYGLNDAFDRAVALLVRKRRLNNAEDLRRRKMVLKHPCLQTGYKEQYVCSHCAGLPLHGAPAIGSKYSTTGKGQTGLTVELRGAPQWEECNALAKTTVNLSEWSNTSGAIDCDIRPCALADSLPRPQGQFYAMSGFFVVFRFFNLSSDATLEDMLQKGQKFCEKKWEVAKKSVAPQPFIEQYCFRAPYVSMLLKYGLHIRDSQVVIGAGSVTWTLGVALMEAGQELSGRVDFHDYKMFPRNISSAGFVLVLLVAPVLLFFLVSFACRLLHRFFPGAYLPIRRHNITSNGSILNFRHWSPIISGEDVKMPLSPTVAGSEQHPFRMENSLKGSNFQSASSRSSATSILRSYSGGFSHASFTNGIGHFWPHRSQMQLWRKRSLSREDLRSSAAEVHTLKS